MQITLSQLTLFLSAIFHAQAVPTLTADGGVCIPPTEDQMTTDTMNRLEIFTNMAQLAANGNTQGIRDQCAQLPSAMCTNEAMNFLGDADMIESLQNQEQELTPIGGEPNELGDDATGANFEKIMEAGDQLITALNEQAGAPVLPSLSHLISSSAENTATTHHHQLVKRSPQPPSSFPHDPTPDTPRRSALRRALHAIKRGFQNAVRVVTRKTTQVSLLVVGAVATLASLVWGVAVGAVACGMGALGAVCAMPFGIYGCIFPGESVNGYFGQDIRMFNCNGHDFLFCVLYSHFAFSDSPPISGSWYAWCAHIHRSWRRILLAQ